MASLKEKLETLKKSVEELEARWSENSSLLSETKAKYEALVTEKEELSRKTRLRTQEIDRKSKNVTDAESRLEAANKLKEESNSKVDSIKDETEAIDAADKEIDILKLALAEKESVIADVNRRIRKTENDIEVEKKRIINSTNKLNETKALVEEVTASLAALGENPSLAEDEAKELQSDLERQFREANVAREEVQRNIRALERSREDLKTRLTNTNNSLAKLEAEKIQFDSEVS